MPWPNELDIFTDVTPSQARNNPSLAGNLNKIFAALRTIQETFGLDPQLPFGTVDERLDILAGASAPSGIGVKWYGPVGTIPAGWVASLGQTVPRVGTYAGIFAAYGTMWGIGDGSTTFVLPDTRGRQDIGVDGGSGRFASAIEGAAGGQSTFTITTGHLPSHVHPITHNHDQFNSGSAGGHNHTGSTGSAGGHNHSASTGSAGGHSHSTSTVGNHDHTGRFFAMGNPGGSGLGVFVTSTTSASGSANLQSGTGPDGGHGHSISSAGAHTHSVSVASSGAHTHSFTTSTASAHSHTINVPNFVGNSGATGGGTPINIVGPWIAGYTILKL